MSAGIVEIVRLARDNLALELCPVLGGSIAKFRFNHPAGGMIDLLRPTSAASLAKGDIEAVACFPLTPFSNRLRQGRFTFEGREIALPLNTSGPHVEHGHGWQNPWQAIDATPESAVLRLAHKSDAWPFDYVMEQRFHLGADGLEIELITRNESNMPMPYGFGLHPYFPRTPECRLTAAVSGFWETDAEVMPLHHTTPPAALDPAKGLPVADRVMDNAFTSWQRRAVIDWPERATRLAMTATGPLGVLVVYIPPGENYFCAEPVSNITDAFNLAHERSDTGMQIVGPGASVSARVTLRPEALG
ncbi:MAG TPA: aldose 1-epimerase [Dongiaceae bacterium]|jgi:aldose 1-epimerase